jgi:hypothetical protein
MTQTFELALVNRTFCFQSTSTDGTWVKIWGEKGGSGNEQGLEDSLAADIVGRHRGKFNEVKKMIKVMSS